MTKDDYITLVAKKKLEIYVMYCWPRITFDTKTKEMSVEYVWRNDEAKKLFESLGEILEIENTELLKQRYAMQEMKIKELAGRQ